jgi:DNA-binding response OmpR family regulator
MTPRERATILLIEPQPDTARRYADTLERAGFRVEAVSAEGERRDLRPDLIILSVSHLDRSQLCAIANDRVVPRIALSSQAADADRALEFGYAAVLIRPVMYDRLVTEVRRVLKKIEQPA